MWRYVLRFVISLAVVNLGEPRRRYSATNGFAAEGGSASGIVFICGRPWSTVAIAEPGATDLGR